jgi:hypothetical protein
VTWQLANAKVWDGSQWVAAVGGAKPWWATIGQVRVGFASAVTVTGSASANTKGAWTELIASTSADGDFITLGSTNIGSGATNSATLIDIGVGAAGAEVAVASNIAIGSWVDMSANIPLKIASGSRVAARIQSVQTSKSAVIRCQVFSSGSYADAPSSVDVIGTSTANSEGTTMLSTNAWVQLVASTSQAYSALVAIPSMTDNVTAGLTVNYSVGQGSAGSETVIGTFSVLTTTGEVVLPGAVMSPMVFAGPFPAGTRLVGRADAAAGTDMDLCVIGIP